MTWPTWTLSVVTAMAGARSAISARAWAESSESNTPTDVPLSGGSAIQ